MLLEHDVPAAYAMARFARGALGGAQLENCDPIVPYMSYWVALNNIYSHLWPQLEHDAEQVAALGANLPASVADALIAHDSTPWFARRIPTWRGQPIRTDSQGRRVNGVVKVGRTRDAEHPQFAGVDIGAMRRYTDGTAEHRAAARALLGAQIVSLLYAVRNNLFHGNKTIALQEERDVVRYGLPLIAIIVESYIEP